MDTRWSLCIAAAGLAGATLVLAQAPAQAPVQSQVQAQPPVAVTTQSVNVRTAPDRSFPTATWFLRGTTVTVVGCTEDWRWCDVIGGGDRGWVYTRYLAYTHDGNTASIMDGGPGLGLPVTPFSLATYWGEHYQGRLWAERQPYWQTRWEHRPPPRAWRAPRATNP
jgi:uncharacterized protein YraI